MKNRQEPISMPYSGTLFSVNKKAYFRQSWFKCCFGSHEASKELKFFHFTRYSLSFKLERKIFKFCI